MKSLIPECIAFYHMGIFINAEMKGLSCIGVHCYPLSRELQLYCSLLELYCND